MVDTKGKGKDGQQKHVIIIGGLKLRSFPSSRFPATDMLIIQVPVSEV
jgi:hypothetical protein